MYNKHVFTFIFMIKCEHITKKKKKENTIKFQWKTNDRILIKYYLIFIFYFYRFIGVFYTIFFSPLSLLFKVLYEPLFKPFNVRNTFSCLQIFCINKISNFTWCIYILYSKWIWFPNVYTATTSRWILTLHNISATFDQTLVTRSVSSTVSISREQ